MLSVSPYSITKHKAIAFGNAMTAEKANPAEADSRISNIAHAKEKLSRVIAREPDLFIKLGVSDPETAAGILNGYNLDTPSERDFMIQDNLERLLAAKQRRAKKADNVVTTIMRRMTKIEDDPKKLDQITRFKGPDYIKWDKLRQMRNRISTIAEGLQPEIAQLHGNLDEIQGGVSYWNGKFAECIRSINHAKDVAIFEGLAAAAMKRIK